MRTQCTIHTYVSEYVLLCILFLAVSIKLPFIVNTLNICILVVSLGATVLNICLTTFHAQFGCNSHVTVMPYRLTSVHSREERQWRQWVDDTLVHTLAPNIYRLV